MDLDIACEFSGKFLKNSGENFKVIADFVTLWDIEAWIFIHNIESAGISEAGFSDFFNLFGLTQRILEKDFTSNWVFGLLT